LRGIDAKDQRQDDDRDQPQAAAAEHHARPAKTAAAITFTTAVFDIVGGAQIIQTHACSISAPSQS
jgi:hypothetical protein